MFTLSKEDAAIFNASVAISAQIIIQQIKLLPGIAEALQFDLEALSKLEQTELTHEGMQLVISAGAYTSVPTENNYAQARKQLAKVAELLQSTEK